MTRPLWRNTRYGFNELSQHIKQYAPEKVAEITWVPAEAIRKAARMYAEAKPAALQWGNAIEHDVNVFDATRALACLMGISGNLDVPGGNVNARDPKIMGLGAVCPCRSHPRQTQGDDQRPSSRHPEADDHRPGLLPQGRLGRQALSRAAATMGCARTR